LPVFYFLQPVVVVVKLSVFLLFEQLLLLVTGVGVLVAVFVV
jgi:hypothetical protein